MPEGLTGVSQPADDLQIEDILINALECRLFYRLGRRPVRIALDTTVSEFGQAKFDKACSKAFPDPLYLQ